MLAFDVHAKSSAIGAFRHGENIDLPPAEIWTHAASLVTAPVFPPKPAFAHFDLLIFQASRTCPIRTICLLKKEARKLAICGQSLGNGFAVAMLNARPDPHHINYPKSS
jgi:hypothetical protein